MSARLRARLEGPIPRISAVGLVAVALVASPARASTPSLGDLPTGAVLSPRSSAKAPPAVDARERSALFLVDGQSDPPTVGPAGDVEGQQCFAVRSPNAEPIDGWEIGLAPRAYADGPIVRAHTERIVESGGEAKLLATDAWVDLRTRGVRVFAESTLPLRLLGPSRFGLRAFAGRERTGDAERVHVVVVKDTGAFTGEPALRNDGAAIGTSSCRHVRFVLHASGKVETASITTPVTARLPAGAEPSGDAPPEPPDVHLRMLGLHFGLSQTSKDTTPLLAVTAGWEGPSPGGRPVRQLRK